MQILNNVWKWIMKHAVFIIIGLLVGLYAYASLQTIQHEKRKSNNDFKCQSLCFPQQHEYLFAGELAACWCYESADTLKKLDK